MAGSKNPDARFSSLPEVPPDSNLQCSETQSAELYHPELQSFEPIASGFARDDKGSQLIEDLSCIKPGEIVGERYRVQSLIGHGGMGKVYKVEQIYLRQELALKVLNALSVTDVSVRRFQHEARAAFGIDHPNLIAVHDFGLLDDKIPFLVMDYVPGKSLADRIRESGALSVEEAVPIFLRICFGLGYAHDRGVIHRDIKPSNIMLVDSLKTEDDGSVKIVDFGIAKFTQFERDDIQALTRTGEVFGSPLYMSPEQCSGSPVDQRSDIYSLGCVFFEALTGTTPFVGANALSTMMKHMGEGLPTMKEAAMGKAFPPLLEQIIAKMLAKKASERYQSLNQVTGDLAVLERNMADPQLLANTLMVASPPKDVNTRTISVSLPILLAATTLVVFLSAAVSCLLTAQFGTGRQEHESDIAALAGQSKNSDFRHFPSGEAKQVPHVVDPKTGRPNVTERAIREATRRIDPSGRISLRYINLPRSTLDDVSRAKWIRSLDLIGCGCDNSSMGVLTKLPKLERISLSHSTLDDEGAAAVSKCLHVNTLSASWTNITEKAAIYFSLMPALNRLELSGIRLTPVSIRSLARSEQLRQLELSYASGIDDESFAPMVDSTLEFINVENVPIGDSAAVYFSKMRNLQGISIAGTNVSAAGLKDLLKNKKLTRIMYSLTPQLTRTDVLRLSKKHPRCHFSEGYQKGDAM